ncbi:MAG: hypothetical protein B7Y39_13420 [Bdellovibrio sp. 28-41-41]|nr:MAG: hypothetical protein B7Y39_13420 [Bdellovibrio sp. 28-41-41]
MNMFKQMKILLVIILYFALSIAEPHHILIEKGIEGFYDVTTAHKMRLVARLNELLDSPKFYEAMPEFKILKNHKEDVIRLVMEHDSSKLFLNKKDPSIQVAGKMNGMDWRSLPDSDPLKQEAKNAFANLTKLDISHESKSARTIFPVEKLVREAAEDLVQMADLDDVPRMRGAEFGAGKELKRSFVPASEWIKKPSVNKGMSPERLKRAVKLGRVLERPEFGYSKKILSYTAETVKGKKFESLAKAYIKVDCPTCKFSPVAKDFASSKKLISARFGIRTLSLIPAAALAISEVYSFAQDPNQNLQENIMKKVLLLKFPAPFSSQKPSCHFEKCHRFILECQNELGNKNVDWEKCVDYFLTLDLDKQKKLLTDIDLKKSLAKRAPVITNLTCQDNSRELKAHVEFEHLSALANKLEPQNQSVLFNDSGRIKTMFIGKQSEESTYERIFFEGNRPTSIQRCENSGTCENLNVGKVMNYGFRAPRSSRGISFIRLQSENIKKCCQSKSCEAYFREKKPNYTLNAGIDYSQVK